MELTRTHPERSDISSVDAVGSGKGTWPTHAVIRAIRSPAAYAALFHPDDLRTAAATCRSAGAVGGGHPAIPRLVAHLARPGTTRILDLGAGKIAMQAYALRERGYVVDALDVGPNFNPDHHAITAFRRRYDIVYASNVINVQVSDHMLRTTVAVATALLAPGGMALANYPQDPRLLPYCTTEMGVRIAAVAGSCRWLTPIERRGYSAPVAVFGPV